jgi:hypothetical protein
MANFGHFLKSVRKKVKNLQKRVACGVSSFSYSAH